MSKEGKFLVFCVEQYKNAKNLSGKQVVELFDKHGVWQYVIAFYESMHITSPECIIEDIDALIAEA